MESMEKDKIRLLALDLDYTLLTSDFTITAGSRKIIEKIRKDGKIIVLASGRIPETMERYVRNLNLHRNPAYLISNNGALVWESHTENILYESLLDKETILEVCKLSDAEGFPLQMYADNITYISMQNDFSSMDVQYTGLRQVVVENFRAMIGDGCYELTIPGEPGKLENIEKLIKEKLKDKVDTYISRKHFLQINSANVNKGTALAKLCDSLGIKASEVLSMGDSMNDEEMISWAGVGVAMANGDERLKKIAGNVTKHGNDEDGAAEFLKNYFY